MNATKRQTAFWPKIKEVYSQTFLLLKENPTIWMLFAVIGICDAIALALLTMAPDSFMTPILAPLIRSFHGERFLHYPENFMILPKLQHNAHLAILCILGIIITGIVILKIDAHLKGDRIATLSAIPKVVMKYAGLLVAWLVAYGVFRSAVVWGLPIFPRSLIVQLSVAFIAGLIIQSFFAYLIPALLLGQKGFLKDLGDGIRFGVKYLPLTCGLIFVPMLVAIMLSYLKAVTPILIRTMPETVLVILGIGIIVMIVVDLIVTVTTTILFLKERKNL